MAKRYRFRFKTMDVYQAAVQHFAWTVDVVGRQLYRYAQGSTFESASYLDALSALDVITDDEYNAQEDHLARVAAMLTRLMQSERRKRGPRARTSKSPRPQAAASKSEARQRVASKSPRSGRRTSILHDDPDT